MTDETYRAWWRGTLSRNGTGRLDRGFAAAGPRAHAGLDGFVLRSDLLLARATDEGATPLARFERPMPVLPESLSLAKAFNEMLRARAQVVQVVDEYGVLAGILTMEDIIETLLGLEIVDEGDEAADMQDLARRLWRKRARAMGIDPDFPDL